MRRSPTHDVPWDTTLHRSTLHAQIGDQDRNFLISTNDMEMWRGSVQLVLHDLDRAKPRHNSHITHSKTRTLQRVAVTRPLYRLLRPALQPDRAAVGMG